MKVDLHLHSVYSDGHDTIEQLATLASKQQITHLSITDHDTVDAYDDPEIALFHDKGIELIPGIEINSEGPNGELHILGYGIDVQNENLRQYCQWRKENRIEWSQQIVAKLNQIGLQVKWENCMERAQNGIIVRTHIAEEIKERHGFPSWKEPYEQYLVKGKPAYVQRAPFSSKEAIQLIKQAGGLPFLAHPGLYKMDWSFQRVLREGIAGIEVFYSKHDVKVTNEWLRRSKLFHLHQSVGSDYHGKQSRNPYLPGSVKYDPTNIHQWIQQLEGSFV